MPANMKVIPIPMRRDHNGVIRLIILKGVLLNFSMFFENPSQSTQAMNNDPKSMAFYKPQHY